MRVFLLLLFTLVNSLFLLSQNQTIDSKKNSDDTEATLASLEEKGLKAYQEADYQASIFWKEKLVKEAKSQLNKEDVRLYVYIKNLAFLYKKTSELNKAEQLYEEARQMLDDLGMQDYVLVDNEEG